MSTHVETQSKRERTWIYLAVCVVLGAIVIAGLVAFSSARESREAEEKADQLIAAIEDAGATAPRKTRSCASSATTVGPPARTRTTR